MQAMQPMQAVNAQPVAQPGVYAQPMHHAQLMVQQTATATAMPANLVPMPETSVSMVTGTPVAPEVRPIAKATPIAAAAPSVNFTVSLDLDKRSALQTSRGTLPQSLRVLGVSEDEWREVCDRLLEFHEGNFFYMNCGVIAATCECCYWCVPLGPFQMVLCMLNPCSWVLCMLPEERASKKTNAAIMDVLVKYGVHCAVETGLANKAKFWTA